MGQISHTFTKEIIDKMTYFYEDNTEKSPQGAIFRARTDNAIITAYHSGKVLFQGKNPTEEAAIWTTFTNETNEQVTFKETQPQMNNPYSPPANFFTSSHIGSDESGTGDYFGPVTAAAVYVETSQIDALKKLGIQDSKAINDETIIKLATKLAEMKIPYSSMVIPNEKYNEIQQNGWTQGKMKAMIHQGVIESLLNKLGPVNSEGILIDQFCQPPVFINHIEREGKTLAPNTYFITKAETHSIAVAAASVLARYRFITEMDKISDMVGMPILKGASNKVDQQIAQIIQAHGREMLPKIAKVHFANTEKAEKYL
ncbi:MAG TPA: ribonuclease HIII [Pseudogracilibacillus sp.]|nr:ribonuclease HIII [Pseudogracilibacillus sp.]